MISTINLLQSFLLSSCKNIFTEQLGLSLDLRIDPVKVTIKQKYSIYYDLFITRKYSYAALQARPN